MWLTSIIAAGLSLETLLGLLDSLLLLILLFKVLKLEEIDIFIKLLGIFKG